VGTSSPDGEVKKLMERFVMLTAQTPSTYTV
jgi:hypothetical protein